MTSVHREAGVRVLALGVAVTVAGCGGGGGSGGGGPIGIIPTSVPTAPPTNSPAPSGGSTSAPAGTYVAVSITFPARAAGSSLRRRPAYVSPSIQSLSITLDGGAAIYVNAPKPTGAPQTVTTNVPAPLGTHTFVLAEYDQNNGGGNLLGRVTQSATVVETAANVLNFTLNGNLAKIVIQPPATPFLEGTLASGLMLVGCQPQVFNALPEDADGNTIVQPGLIPQISESSASSAIVVTPTSTTNQFTVEGAAPSSAIKITATGTDLNNNAVPAASFTIGSTAAFYIADFTAQAVRVFDESGTPLALPNTAFPAITNPMGLAATPCTATTSGNVYLTETSNPKYPYVAEFDMNGNPLTLAGTAFTFMPGYYQTPQALLLSYGANTLFVPDEYSSMISEFDTSGNPISLASGTYTHLAQPVQALYDPHNQQVYVTNEGTAAMTVYSAAGAYIGTVATNSHPFAIAFDSNNNSLYVASGGTSGSALDQTTPSPANVAEFSEVPAAVSNTGGFTATSTTAFYTGIAFDPYSKQLYVSDAGDSKIVAYTEAGASVTLPSTAFSTISSTATPKGDPMGILFVP